MIIPAPRSPNFGVRANLQTAALSSYTTTGCSLSSYGGTARFSGAQTFTEDTGTSLHEIAGDIAGLDATKTVVLSIDVESTGTRQYCRLRCNEVGAGANWFEAIFDLSGVSVANTYSNGSGSVGGADIRDIDGNIRRCWVYGVTGVGSSSGIVPRFAGNSNAFGSGRNYTGTSQTYAICGLKLEYGEDPTAYEGLGS